MPVCFKPHNNKLCTHYNGAFCNLHVLCDTSCWVFLKHHLKIEFETENIINISIRQRMELYFSYTRIKHLLSIIINICTLAIYILNSTSWLHSTYWEVYLVSNTSYVPFQSIKHKVLHKTLESFSMHHM